MNVLKTIFTLHNVVAALVIDTLAVGLAAAALVGAVLWNDATIEVRAPIALSVNE
jgi:hypothetical protein